MERRRVRAELRRTVLAVWLPGLLVVGVAVAIALTTDVTLRTLMQDTTTVLGAPFYVGSLSLAGVIGWSAAAGVSLFAAAIASRPEARSTRSLLLAMGILTAVLLVDDAFLIHDEIVPQYLGISGELIGVGYVVVTLAILYLHRAVITYTNYPLLVAALVLLGVSAAVDIASTFLVRVVPTNLVTIGEDGTKLVGIWTWFAYLASVSRQSLASAPAEGRSRTP
jgi:hypothetical protein